MSVDLILREVPSTTVADLAEHLNKTQPKFAQTTNDQIRVNVRDSEVQVGENLSVPLTSRGIKAFGTWLDIPTKFLERADDEAQQFLLDHYLQRNRGGVMVVYHDDGIETLRSPDLKFIDPRRVVDIAGRVVDERGIVLDYWNNPDEFRLDVIVPEGFDRGIGGDRRKGDITRGGIRIGQNTKANLAPWVSEFLFRLFCTNGMEVMDETNKVDARGATVDEVLMEFEILADRAFRRVEGTIASFYEMRDQKVDNPERTILRMADEQNIPARTAMRLAELAPAIEDPNMFEVINLITNQANDPALKDGPRRNLQLAGGRAVTEHAARCGHCQARLN